jgi:hypothetical protein
MDNPPVSVDPNVTVDQRSDGPGVSRIDPSDPAAPQYLMLARMRSPETLRDLMIKPVRTGYIGQDHPIDPKELPPSAAQHTRRFWSPRFSYHLPPVRSAARCLQTHARHGLGR